MSFIKVWIHYVWATKNHESLLQQDFRKLIFSHILEQNRKKGIWIDTINGHNNHVHALISLGKEQTIAKVAMLMKGESSHWINEKKFLKNKLQWQDDYYAVSVSESQVERVRAYILNQEEHHRKKSFQEETEVFVEKYGWNRMKDGVSG